MLLCCHAHPRAACARRWRRAGLPLPPPPPPRPRSPTPAPLLPLGCALRASTPARWLRRCDAPRALLARRPWRLCASQRQRPPRKCSPRLPSCPAPRSAQQLRPSAKQPRRPPLSCWRASLSRLRTLRLSRCCARCLPRRCSPRAARACPCPQLRAHRLRPPPRRRGSSMRHPCTPPPQQRRCGVWDRRLHARGGLRWTRRCCGCCGAAKRGWWLGARR